MDIYYAISVLLLVLDFAKAQPDPWICNFQSNECEISDSFADDTFWFVDTYDGNGYYRAAINPVGETYYSSGTFATFILPPASYPNSGRGVLSFRFFSNTDDMIIHDGYLKVTTCEDKDRVLTLGSRHTVWSFREIEFTCGSTPVKISFTAVRGSFYTLIGVDDIKVTEITTTTTEAVASATSLATRIQTLTPSISPSLTSSSIPTYTDSTARYNMSTGSILENTGKAGSLRSNHVVLPVVSSICIVLLIFLIVTGYVFWRKRYRPTDIEDKGSGDNGDKLYTNPVYSSHDNAHSQPDILVSTPTGHLSQETQQAQESIDEYEDFEGDSNPQLYSMPLRKQDRSERTGDNQTDIKDKNLPGQAVLYDDEEYNALDFNRDKFPKTNKIFITSQTYKPSLPENSSETITDDASDYGVLECPGAVGDDDYKAPRYENSEPGVPSEAEQMEEGPEYYSYQDSLPVRPEDESFIEHARSAADAPHEGDFEPIYSDEVYGEF